MRLVIPNIRFATVRQSSGRTERPLSRKGSCPVGERVCSGPVEQVIEGQANMRACVKLRATGFALPSSMYEESIYPQAVSLLSLCRALSRPHWWELRHSRGGIGYSQFRSAQPIFVNLGSRCASCIHQVGICGSYGGNNMERISCNRSARRCGRAWAEPVLG